MAITKHVGCACGAATTCALFAPIAVFLTANNYPFLSVETALLGVLCAASGLLVRFLTQFTNDFVSRIVFCGVVIVSISILAQTDSQPTFLGICIGCVLAFYILRKHIGLITLIAFSGHIVATLVVSLGTQIQEIHSEQYPQYTDNEVNGPPPILHILLDEHVGIHGLPKDIPRAAILAESLRNFYTHEGFRLYSRAYSQYIHTSESLSNMFNFASRTNIDAFTSVRVPNDLTKTNLAYYHSLNASKYFKHLNRLGYRLNIYQTDFFDLCHVPDIEYATCKTYRSNSIMSILNTDLDVVERFKFVANSFVGSSVFLQWLRWIYNHHIRTLNAPPLPIWAEGNNRTGPLPTLRMLKLLEIDLENAKPGNVYFAHLLLPHYPYILHSDCKLRKRITDWLNRVATHDPAQPLVENTSKTRAQRYDRYIDQIECQQILLSNLLNTINNNSVWNDSTVIIHGDHGSRIALHKPGLTIADKPSTDDQIAYHSTLFAVRFGNDAKGESVETPHSLQFLLAHTFGIPIEADLNEMHFVKQARKLASKIRRPGRNPDG